MVFRRGKKVLRHFLLRLNTQEVVMFNNFLRDYPLFLAAVYGAVYYLAKDALDLGLSNGVIDQGFFEKLMTSVGQNEPDPPIDPGPTV